MRDAFAEQLRLTQARRRFYLYAWVLMPNHAHLLIREPGRGDLAGILRTLKVGLSKRVMRRWSELDALVLDRLIDARGVRCFWQPGGGYDRNLFSEAEFDEKVRYIHENPVRSWLVGRPMEWAWSSAPWWGGERAGQFACVGRSAGGEDALFLS